MVNWYIKNKINSLSFEELFDYLKKCYVPASNKQMLPVQKEKSGIIARFKTKIKDSFYGNETYEYILANMAKSLEGWRDQYRFVNKFNSNSVMEQEIMMDIMERNMEAIIPILNQEQIYTLRQEFVLSSLMGLISTQLRLNGGQEERYKSIFMRLYKGIESDVFSVDDLACDSPKEWILSCLESGKLKSPDIINCIKFFGRDPDNRKLVLEHSENFMKETSNPIKTLEYMKKYGIANDKIKEIMDSRKEAVIREMCNGDKEVFSLMIKELMGKEGVRPSDVTFVGGGVYSKVFGIGSKVVKVGNDAMTYKIPKNSSRFLQPLVRHQQEGEGRIEISEKVDMKTEVSEEELYQVYADIRREGMIWTDAKYDNVGRLAKDNSVHFKNFVHNNTGDEEKTQVDIKPHGPNLGFGNEEQSKVLEAGELVVVDLDFIFAEDDPNIRISTDFSRNFEKRYQRELKEKSEHDHSYSIESCLKVSENVPALEQQKVIAAMIDIERKEVSKKGSVELGK